MIISYMKYNIFIHVLLGSCLGTANFLFHISITVSDRADLSSRTTTEIILAHLQ